MLDIDPPLTPISEDASPIQKSVARVPAMPGGKSSPSRQFVAARTEACPR